MLKHSPIAGVLILILVVAGLLLLPQAPAVQGQTGETILSGYAWSSNIGWISFRGGNYGVRISPEGLFSGYAWSSNIGWINFAPGGSYPASPNQAARFDPTTNQASGWARAIAPNASGISGWDGWIKLSGSNYGVTRVQGGAGQSDHFRGYAWGNDVVGWIDWELVRIGGLSAVCSVSVTGNTATWSASVTGGIAPLTYQWAVTNSTGTSGSNDLTFVMTDIADDTYTGSFTVRDSSTPSRVETCGTSIVPDTEDPPVIITYPTLSTLNNQNNISIASQPLTSPAISSGITIVASTDSVATDQPLYVRVLDIVSLTSGKSLLSNPANSNGGILTGVGNQRLPTCYLSREPFSAGASFSDCLDIGPLSMTGSSGNNTAHFHINIDRPVQAMSDHNPYEVILGDPTVTNPASRASFLFDYRVATVNPV